jgi:hypothetical protein
VDGRFGEGDFISVPFGAEVELLELALLVVLGVGSTETLSSDPDLDLTSSDLEAILVFVIDSRVRPTCA